MDYGDGKQMLLREQTSSQDRLTLVSRSYSGSTPRLEEVSATAGTSDFRKAKEMAWGALVLNVDETARNGEERTQRAKRPRLEDQDVVKSKRSAKRIKSEDKALCDKVAVGAVEDKAENAELDMDGWEADYNLPK